ncbi:hypothetical protein MCOR27_008952 [Pyricularia oryzae]|uniref:U3 small nucleolar RNA-associated protein 11 n=5 Tax=Pyricularia TaxID=48558 RepID=A0ABQ8NJN4_PYRGI|nr:uncharacterized protein MGG_01315 [Pyricularia oryzae 70-15]ADD84617.1 hypothetical protein [Pyricularia oryzae]ELQ44075.1 hypothetical protein OOU_Y34scaffold00103g19 [Pyricularia oryzae Y34]KAI6297705.1 hypothetical protein MCOR33_006032 [Pyricularia grisea]EHA54433.1 hypothetical protein MGG_01315 [Pyricularia oryzae 70-15]KAH9438492.1 hypothetical protein MCOR02_002111 [Pyricularia oryzae]
MPSFNKLGQKPTHKERAQPLERKHLGLLEKHKDYSLRAKDFNKKKAYLKTLRQKAAERNEDEFYHKMLSRTGPGSALTKGAKGRNFTGTVSGDRGNTSMDVDVVRILKTQDIAYVRTLRNTLAKDVRQCEERLAIAESFAGVPHEDVGGDEGGSGSDDDERPTKRRKASKIKFFDDEADRDRAAEDATPDKADEDDDDDFENFGDEDGEDDKEMTEDEKRALKLERLRRNLRNARRKLKALADAEAELDLQRVRMAKTATRGAVTKSGKKIKKVFERKR